MRSLAKTFAVWSLLIAPLWAQSGANVTLQLPSFHTFGVNTSVLVPDSGPSPLARERQAYYSRFTPGGLNASRSAGIQRRDALVAATAQIHDPQAAEAELLRATKARRANLSRHSLAAGVQSSSAERRAPVQDAAPQSPAQIARDQADQLAAGRREATQLLAQARRAQQAGKNGAAGVYYEMAARQATGALKQQIERERAQLSAVSARAARP